MYDRIRALIGGWDQNVGPFDSKVRVLIGSILVLLAPLQVFGYVELPVFSSIGAAFAGIVLIVEGLLNRCVLYSLLGINRCPVDIEEDSES